MYFKSHSILLYNEYSNHHWLAYKGNTNREKSNTRELWLISCFGKIGKTYQLAYGKQGT